MLHTVNKSPFCNGTLNSCLRMSQDGCAILLIEDGVYGATDGSSVSDQVKDAMKTKSVYALKPDVDARGISAKIIDGIELIDYAGFVNLVADQKATQSWL